MLFDLDGTLADSSYPHTLCWWQAFRQYGRDVPMAAIHRDIGMGSGELTRYLEPGIAESEIAEPPASHDAHYASHWPAIGLDCIGLERGGTSAAELREAGALATFQSPADLLTPVRT